jgi:excisionase family DNA binding protein
MIAKTDSVESAVAPMLTQQEVAALFRVSMKTIYNWRMTGVLTGMKAGGVIRFKRADVLALMDNPGTQ